EAVALFDQTSFGKLLVQGPDAESALQRLCAADTAVAPGRVVYTGLLNARGGYESDLTVTRLDETRFMLVTGTAQPIRDRHWIRRNLRPEERVTVTDVSGAEAVFSVMGPRARDLLQSLTDADLSNAAFPLFTARAIALGHATVRAARLSYVGELGWELYTPVEMAAGLYDTLFEAGAAHGLRDAGMQALASLRIEKGFRAWGHEIGPDDTPLEAGLAFATKLKSDIDFLGRDALLRRRKQGIASRLVHFICDDTALFPRGDEPLLKDGAIVGQVTSAAFGHTVGRSCGMGYIRLDGAQPAEFVASGRFEIELACTRHPITVSLQAPYDPKGERMRA
ncbi:MAG: aminomethyl transferase family protein, partial [Rhodospirillaceae bacterium]|nr:aminomethyl transferase family protein [Rhodospirillaceae bacterium]